jgi:hypothetical protein
MKSVNLFLRDAGVILDDGEADFWRRLQRCAALAGDNGLNIQVTLGTHYFLKEHAGAAAGLIDQLKKFPRALIHLHTTYSRPFGRNAFTDKALAVLAELAAACGNIKGICVHPDCVEDFSVLARLKTDETYIAVEVLGKEARSGNRFAEITDILKAHGFLDLVLDTAHIMEMADAGEPGLGAYLETFGDRIKELHVSRPENLYAPEVVGAGFTTSHSLLTLKKGDNIIEPLAAWSPAGEVNTVIEGIIPAGGYGETCLKNEVAYLKKHLHTRYYPPGDFHV